MHSHLAKMLGQYISDTRQELSMRQRELANVLGISAQFLGRVEKGDVMIPDDVLSHCISILKLSRAQIITIYRAAGEKKAELIFQSSRERLKSKKQG
jgi:DNA-binding XRE family transcriptional regulator